MSGFIRFVDEVNGEKLTNKETPIHIETPFLLCHIEAPFQIIGLYYAGPNLTPAPFTPALITAA